MFAGSTLRTIVLGSLSWTWILELCLRKRSPFWKTWPRKILSFGFGKSCREKSLGFGFAEYGLGKGNTFKVLVLESLILKNNLGFGVGKPISETKKSK